MRVDGVTRDYTIHVPKAYNHLIPAPVWLFLQDDADPLDPPKDDARAREIQGALERGRIVGVFAHPAAPADGHKPAWQHGLCDSAPGEGKADDVAFLTALLLELRRTLVVDKNRVYLVGVGTGAVMAQRAAAAFGSRIAGVAAFGGAAGCKPEGSSDPKMLPAPAGAMDVVLVHGRKNPRFPYGGGKPAGQGGSESFAWISSDESFAFWAEANQCRGKPKREKPTQDTARESVDCANGTTTLTRYTVEEVGDGWPARVAGGIPAKILLEAFGR